MVTQALASVDSAGSVPAGDGGAFDCTYTLPRAQRSARARRLAAGKTAPQPKSTGPRRWRVARLQRRARHLTQGANLGSFGGGGAIGVNWQRRLYTDDSHADEQPELAKAVREPAHSSAEPLQCEEQGCDVTKGAGCTGTTAFWIGPGPDPACDNLSAFQGFTFETMADANVDITAFVTMKDDPSQSRTPMTFHATTAWQKFSVPFCALSNASTFNAANVAEVRFQRDRGGISHSD